MGSLEVRLSTLHPRQGSSHYHQDPFAPQTLHTQDAAPEAMIKRPPSPVCRSLQCSNSLQDQEVLPNKPESPGLQTWPFLLVLLGMDRRAQQPPSISPPAL